MVFPSASTRLVHMLYTHTLTHDHKRTHAHMHTSTQHTRTLTYRSYAYMRIHTHTYTNPLTYTRPHSYIHTFTDKLSHISGIYTHARTHAHTHTRTHARTHTHTHTFTYIAVLHITRYDIIISCLNILTITSIPLKFVRNRCAYGITQHKGSITQSLVICYSVCPFY